MCSLHCWMKILWSLLKVALSPFVTKQKHTLITL